LLKKKLYNFNSDIWSWTQLQDVLTTSIGGTPSKSISSYWDNGNIPWINSGALKNLVISEPSNFITEDGLMNSSARLFPKNTVLVALTGATLGKVGLLNFECCTNQSVTGIYPSKHINPKFLFYYFIYIRDQLINKATGAAQPHINKGIIDNTVIPIAPIEHQNVVAETLSTVLNKVADVEDKLMKIESLENKAFESFIFNDKELHPEIPLQTFCEQRDEKIGKNWRNKRLIGVSKETGITDLRITKAKTYEKYKIVKSGDFIYNPMRVNIGSVAIYEGDEIALTSPDYVVFQVNNNLSKMLLLKFLKSDWGLKQINNNTRGSVRSRLYFSYLGKITIPYSGDRNQQKAEKILNGFSTMRQQTLILKNDLNTIISQTFENCFKKNNYDDIKYGKAGKEIVKLMIIEKKEQMNTKKKATIKTSTMKSVKTVEIFSLLDFVKKIYKQRRFTFESLYTSSNRSYETLKEDVFELLDKDLLLEFDEKELKMYLKIKVK